VYISSCEFQSVYLFVYLHNWVLEYIFVKLYICDWYCVKYFLFIQWWLTITFLISPILHLSMKFSLLISLCIELWLTVSILFFYLYGFDGDSLNFCLFILLVWESVYLFDYLYSWVELWLTIRLFICQIIQLVMKFILFIRIFILM